VQTYTVPTGITSMSISVAGASSGESSDGAFPTYPGGTVSCVLSVTPGQLLYLYVGGEGGNWNALGWANPGGWNGGGGGGGYYPGGGGASDIRIGGIALTNRVVVAGGGGGGSNYYGGVGFNCAGGAGGGLTGGSGTYDNSYSALQCGSGGSSSSGGAAPSGGSAGTLGSGGTYGGGCGGGGGYYGGGSSNGLGGGGGGSSYTSSSLCSSVVHTQGNIYNSGGQIVLMPICLPGTISGSSSVCYGLTTTLTESVTGGTWTSTNSAVASVGSGSGVVSGVLAGTAIISYQVPAGCFATSTITVIPIPSVISGAGQVCVGSAISLADSASGGIWGSSNTSLAIAGSGSGIVTGVSAGIVNITYSTSCGTPTFITVTVILHAA